MIGLAVLGLLTSLTLGAVAIGLGVRYSADEDLTPLSPTDIDTQPWPAPR